MDSLGSEIYDQVANACEGVSVISGVITYPNNLKFYQLAKFIDSLNILWDEFYAERMEEIMGQSLQLGDWEDEETIEELWDIIEETYFDYPDEKASRSFEERFEFNSLRMQIETGENEWLETSEDYDVANNPSFNEDLPEMFWTLVTPAYGYEVSDPDISNQIEQVTDEEEQRDILEVLHDIVGIMEGVIYGIETLVGLFEDCDGSTEAYINKVRDGYKFENNDKRMIGYQMEQRSVTFDFNHTTTKIKGKAKLWKKKSNGKYKKDRKNTVGISFCAKEWNNCDDIEWPSDSGFYQHPTVLQRRK